MPARISRWRWARTRRDFALRDMLYPLIGFLLYWPISYQFGWDAHVAPLIGSALMAAGAIPLVYIVLLVWDFSRARIVQDRRELAALRAQVAEIALPLELDVRLRGLRRVRVGMLGDGEPWWMIVLDDVRLTNRSSREHLSLEFRLRLETIEPDGQFMWFSEELLRHYVRDPAPGATYLHGPLALPPQRTESGSIGFVMPPEDHPAISRAGIKFGSSIALEVTDLVSRKKLTVLLSGAVVADPDPGTLRP